MPSFSLAKMDAVDWLRKLPTASVGLVVADPPYESLEKYRAVGTTTRLKHSKSSNNDWFSTFPNSRYESLFGELFRVLKNDAHLYLFSDSETMFVVKPIAEAVGFKFWKPLVWDKKKIGMGYHYRARYEFILFFEKGKKQLRDLGVSDVLESPRLRGSDVYPTQKPLELCEVLVSQSTTSGDLVIDPFCGSGTTLMAAAKLGFDSAGCDIADVALELTRRRMAEVSAVEANGLPSSAHGQLVLGG